MPSRKAGADAPPTISARSSGAPRQRPADASASSTESTIVEQERERGQLQRVRERLPQPARHRLLEPRRVAEVAVEQHVLRGSPRTGPAAGRSTPSSSRSLSTAARDALGPSTARAGSIGDSELSRKITAVRNSRTGSIIARRLAAKASTATPPAGRGRRRPRGCRPGRSGRSRCPGTARPSSADRMYGRPWAVIAPELGCRLRRAEPEEREARDRQDQAADVEARRDDDHGQRAGQEVAQPAPARRDARELRRLDVGPAAEGPRLGSARRARRAATRRSPRRSACSRTSARGRRRSPARAPARAARGRRP